MSDFVTMSARRVFDRIYGTEHPLAVLILVCILVHLLIIPLSTDYDIMYWSYVERNIRSGFGLYSVDGYYYTPVWGYILGLSNVLQSYVLDIGEMAVRVQEGLPLEACTVLEMSANIASVAFNYTIKLPLMVFDILMGIGVYYLVLETVGDKRKACMAFFFASFSPYLLGAVCITGMPDTVSACMMVFTILLVRRDRYLLAGMTYSIAVLAKFFPIFLMPVLVVYVLRRRGDFKSGSLSVIQAVVGFAIMSLVLFLPAIIEGNMGSAFAFITDRANTGAGSTLFQLLSTYSRIIVYALALVGSFVVAVLQYRSESENVDASALKSMFLVVMLCMVYPPLPQYFIIAVPFLAYFAATCDVRFRYAWLILLVSAVIIIPVRNAALLMPLSVWAGIVPTGVLVDIFENLSGTYLFGIDLLTLQLSVGTVVQCVGFALIFLTFAKSGKWNYLNPRNGSC